MRNLCSVEILLQPLSTVLNCRRYCGISCGPGFESLRLHQFRRIVQDKAEFIPLSAWCDPTCGDQFKFLEGWPSGRWHLSRKQELVKESRVRIPGPPPWRVGRVVDGTCLENKKAAMSLGFESLTLCQVWSGSSVGRAVD